MLLTIATTISPATDLGFLLHKNPGRVDPQEVPLSFGVGRVFWPEVSDRRCMAALHVAVEPVDRSERQRGRGGEVAYVTDLPYAAGSYLPSAIQRAFGTAIAGRCDNRPQLAASAIPLEIEVTPVACRNALTPGELFGPLGWAVEDIPLPLDPAHPAWGSIHHRIRLTGEMRLSQALRHLCVLLPVLDGRKHYFVGEAEVDKLLRLGEGWLKDHPESRVIGRRYVGFRHLAQAVERAQDIADAPQEVDGAPHERPAVLQELRIAAVAERLAQAGARRVADLGCGEGDLITALLADARFDKVIGVDPSPQALAKAARHLHLDRMGEPARARVELLQGAATYPDSRLAACDAAALLEVVEHIDPWRLQALEAAVFDIMRPRTVVVTTPNREWNALIPALEDGKLRHRDHRFEWTRQEFHDWATSVCAHHGYQFEWFAVGAECAGLGPATQGATFTQAGTRQAGTPQVGHG